MGLLPNGAQNPTFIVPFLGLIHSKYVHIKLRKFVIELADRSQLYYKRPYIKQYKKLTAITTRGLGASLLSHVSFYIPILHQT